MPERYERELSLQDGPLMTKTKITPEEALAYHLEPKPGKYEIVATTPMATQRDLSLAYSPVWRFRCRRSLTGQRRLMIIRSKAIWLP